MTYLLANSHPMHNEQCIFSMALHFSADVARETPVSFRPINSTFDAIGGLSNISRIGPTRLSLHQRVPLRFRRACKIEKTSKSAGSGALKRPVIRSEVMNESPAIQGGKYDPKPKVYATDYSVKSVCVVSTIDALRRIRSNTLTARIEGFGGANG